jgi:hypothetical protein
VRPLGKDITFGAAEESVDVFIKEESDGSEGGQEESFDGITGVEETRETREAKMIPP